MQRADVVMTTRMHPRVIEILDRHFVLHRLWEAPEPAVLLKAIGTRVEGMATSSSYGRTDGALFAVLPKLRIVANAGVGYDHVDVRDAANRGIVVTNTPDVLTDEVADLAVGLLLATVRQLPQADAFVRAGRWPIEAFPLSPTLRGRTVGILGLGRIGKAIARRMAGFGVDVHYQGRQPQPDVALPYHSTPIALAAAVDVLIVSVAGGENTHHLVDADVLKALGPNGILINVSRGSVVDETALIDALAGGVILTAGLDVFANEPHVPHVLIDTGRVVLLPHLGSASVRTREAMAELTADNLISWFSGKGPISPVPETWTDAATRRI